MDEFFNIPLEVLWNIRYKGRINSLVQEPSSSLGGWPKKSKLEVKKMMAKAKPTAAIVTPSVAVSAASTPTMMATKNRTHSKDFRPVMGLREKGKKRKMKGEDKIM